MHKPAALFFLTLGIPFGHVTALAWSGAGHQVVAAAAWHEMTPETRQKAFEVLKSHRDYPKWTNSAASESSGLDLAEFAFLQCSMWPDQIRRHGNKFDHPHWHYVDWSLKPPSFPMEQPPSPDDDVLYGLGECQKVLADSKAPAEERAVYLSWLVHLTGDIHQPLHCVSLFNDAYPNGDKGGNAFYVMPASRGISLHSFWDGLLGTSGKAQAHANYATMILAQFPRASLKELAKDKTAKDWSLEGRSLAIVKAYLHGELKGGATAEDAQPLPAGYTKEAKAVAEKQAALAGYRLADAVRQWLK